jgi:hypothetical protein
VADLGSIRRLYRDPRNLCSLCFLCFQIPSNTAGSSLLSHAAYTTRQNRFIDPLCSLLKVQQIQPRKIDPMVSLNLCGLKRKLACMQNTIESTLRFLLSNKATTHKQSSISCQLSMSPLVLSPSQRRGNTSSSFSLSPTQSLLISSNICIQ